MSQDKKRILIVGAGQMAEPIVDKLFINYNIDLVDSNLDSFNKFRTYKQNINFINKKSRDISYRGYDLVISCVPDDANRTACYNAIENGVRFISLGGDEYLTKDIRVMSRQNKLKAPVCTDFGLAPGLVNNIAEHLVDNLPDIEELEICCGGLPRYPNRYTGKYALTWSLEGLIKEYTNPTKIKLDNNIVELKALSLPKEYEIEGNKLVGFLTHGGIGDSLNLKTRTVSYRTLRHPVTYEILKYIRDYNLNWKQCLENLPKTSEDIVYIIIKCNNSQCYNFVIKPDRNKAFTAMQVATGYSVALAAEKFLQGGYDCTPYLWTPNVFSYFLNWIESC